MRKPLFAIAVVIVAALILGGVRFAERRTEKNRAIIRSELSVLRERMRFAYHERGTLLREWADGTPLAKQAEFNSLLVENAGLELNSQPEFDRFDWVQEQLNGKIGQLLADKKSAVKKPKALEKDEREIVAARAAYVKSAVHAKDVDHLPEEVPIFKAEAMLLAAPKN